IGGQDMTLLRPLLTVRRAEIDHFITANKLRYREDATNASDFATRNRLRHQALPLLADILDRDPVPALLRHAAQARAEAEFLDQHLDSLELRDPQGRLFLPKLRELPPFLQKRALHRFLRDHDTPQLSSKLVEQALDLIAPEAPPALTLPGGSRLRRRQARLFIEDTL
ncbi:MAG: ATP-binding protein, partial [Verrucomicrobiales bacterium]